MTLGNAVLAIVIALVAIVVLWLLFWWLYRRATKELSFVRTGFGGQKVVMNGGALVLPVLHDLIQVNMNALRIDVARAARNALITRDRLRVDVSADFLVRVGADHQHHTDGAALAHRHEGKRLGTPRHADDAGDPLEFAYQRRAAGKRVLDVGIVEIVGVLDLHVADRQRSGVLDPRAVNARLKRRHDADQEDCEAHTARSQPGAQAVAPQIAPRDDDESAP